MENVQKAKQEFQSLLEQAELGDTSVQFDLGAHYANGEGVDRDMEQAVYWAICGLQRPWAGATRWARVWSRTRIGL